MEDELVQITERPTTASMRLLARVTAGTVLEDAAGRKKFGRDLMRDVQKRIMRLSPLVCFEVMEESEIRKEPKLEKNYAPVKPFDLS